MKVTHWVLVGVLLLVSNIAHAEDGCPEGFLPSSAAPSQQAPVACRPIPDYSTDQQQEQPQLPPPPPPQWARRWGAIATDKIRGVLGAVTDLSSKSEAQQAAVVDCLAKGGSPCKLEIAYDNECVTLAVGSKGYSIKTGDTADAANQRAIKTCSGNGEDLNCQVYYSACSLAQRIQ